MKENQHALILYDQNYKGKAEDFAAALELVNMKPDLQQLDTKPEEKLLQCKLPNGALL